MQWKYRIMHSWEEPRTRWAEAFVRPDDPGYDGQSLWVTIDCLCDGPRPVAGDDASPDPDEPYNLHEFVGDRPYRAALNGEVGDSDLVVNAPNFTRDEFLDWIKVWLRLKGFAVTELVEGSMDEFGGTHSHADLIAELTKRYSTNE